MKALYSIFGRLSTYSNDMKNKKLEQFYQ